MQGEFSDSDQKDLSYIDKLSSSEVRKQLISLICDIHPAPLSEIEDKLQALFGKLGQKEAVAIYKKSILLGNIEVSRALIEPFYKLVIRDKPIIYEQTETSHNIDTSNIQEVLALAIRHNNDLTVEMMKNGFVPRDSTWKAAIIMDNCTIFDYMLKHFGFIMPKKIDNEKLLIFVIKKNATSCLRLLATSVLCKPKKHLNHKVMESNPLMIAAECGNTECFKVLVECGASLFAKLWCGTRTTCVYIMLIQRGYKSFIDLVYSNSISDNAANLQDIFDEIGRKSFIVVMSKLLNRNIPTPIILKDDTSDPGVLIEKEADKLMDDLAIDNEAERKMYTAMLSGMPLENNDGAASIV